jgi:hypothetical protein
MVVITKECGITIEYSVYIERLSLRQVRRNRDREFVIQLYNPVSFSVSIDDRSSTTKT